MNSNKLICPNICAPVPGVRGLANRLNSISAPRSAVTSVLGVLEPFWAGGIKSAQIEPVHLPDPWGRWGLTSFFSSGAFLSWTLPQNVLKGIPCSKSRNRPQTQD